MKCDCCGCIKNIKWFFSNIKKNIDDLELGIFFQDIAKWFKSHCCFCFKRKAHLIEDTGEEVQNTAKKANNIFLKVYEELFPGKPIKTENLLKIEMRKEDREDILVVTTTDDDGVPRRSDIKNTDENIFGILKKFLEKGRRKKERGTIERAKKLITHGITLIEQVDKKNSSIYGAFKKELGEIEYLEIRDQTGIDVSEPEAEETYEEYIHRKISIFQKRRDSILEIFVRDAIDKTSHLQENAERFYIVYWKARSYYSQDRENLAFRKIAKKALIEAIQTLQEIDKLEEELSQSDQGKAHLIQSAEKLKKYLSDLHKHGVTPLVAAPESDEMEQNAKTFAENFHHPLLKASAYLALGKSCAFKKQPEARSFLEKAEQAIPEEYKSKKSSMHIDETYDKFECPYENLLSEIEKELKSINFDI